jgi:hypothetical protein
VRAIQRRHGHLIDRTERLANSLGKLCVTVASLNKHMGSGKVGRLFRVYTLDRLSAAEMGPTQ